MEASAISEERLMEIESRIAKATPGPWDSVGLHHRPGRAVVVHHQTKFNHADVFAAGTSLSPGGHAKEEDADFTAAAREDLPACVREIRESRDEVAKLKSKLNAALDRITELEGMVADDPNR